MKIDTWLSIATRAHMIVKRVSQLMVIVFCVMMMFKLFPGCDQLRVWYYEVEMKKVYSDGR